MPRPFWLRGGRPLGDVYDLQLTRFWQHAGNVVNMLGGRYTVGAGAESELSQRADVAEIADAVVFFLTASDFITGQVLAVDGGLSQK